MKAKIGVEYDESALKTQIANLECMKEENQIAPVNAHPEFKTDQICGCTGDGWYNDQD